MPIPFLPGRLALAGALAAVLALSGCSGSDEQEPGGQAAPSVAPASDGAATDGAQSSSQPSEPLPVLASRETSAGSGPRSVPLRVEVNELVRRGELLLLNVTVNNLGTERMQVGNYFDDVDLTQTPEQQQTADGITLVDTANSKKHLVARDSEGDCVCTEGLSAAYIPAGERLVLSATFAAPPEGTETMDVAVPGVGTFPGVPLS